MADNTPFVASTDPAAPKIADDEILYNGDLAKVQLIQLVTVAGPEGSHTGPTKLTDFSQTLTTLLNRFVTDSTFDQTVTVGNSVPAAGIDLLGIKNWGIQIPANFDGTQIFFQTAPTQGGTYQDVYDITNTRVVMTVTAGRYYDVPGELMAVRFLKICTITNQAGTDTIFTVQGKGI